MIKDIVFLAKPQSLVGYLQRFFIFLPVILVTLLLIFGYIFPITKKEFELVHKEIARRKGEDNSETTEEEKKILKRVTGVEYEELWGNKECYGNE